MIQWHEDCQTKKKILASLTSSSSQQFQKMTSDEDCQRKKKMTITRF
jgi:hypothetical protein